MVYIKAWTQFETATIDLYNKSPRKTRYTVKFVPKTGQLVLKVTDDTTCLMYKSHSAIILNRFEALNLRLLSAAANARRRAPLAPVMSRSGSAGAGTPNVVEGDDPMAGGAAAPGAGAKGNTPAKTTGGGKKKKKGKR